jgi:predicted nuclease of predicted toxin-antitoxin system
MERFGITAKPLRDLGLRAAEDAILRTAAREAGVVFVTKDADFEERVRRFGPPPHVLWLTCGNTSEARLKEILEGRLETALALIRSGEPLVEIQ